MLRTPRKKGHEGRSAFAARVAKFDQQFLNIPQVMYEPTDTELKEVSGTSVEGVRRSLLSEAGLNVNFLKKAVQRLDEQLDAEKTVFFSKDGINTDSVNVVDHSTRGKAIDRVFDLEGVRAPKTAAEGQGKTTVNIIVAPWLDR